MRTFLKIYHFVTGLFYSTAENSGITHDIPSQNFVLPPS